MSNSVDSFISYLQVVWIVFVLLSGISQNRTKHVPRKKKILYIGVYAKNIITPCKGQNQFELLKTVEKKLYLSFI